ncbi:MAG TPA: cation-transporting P-type ATPase, partial [Nitrospiria bacterium]|nr:cation-transporting P-type ATPase [Nitrospiria bacterium]
MTKQTDDYGKQPIDDTIRELQTDRARGLARAEAAARLDRVGYNEITEKEEPLWHRLFRRF